MTTTMRIEIFCQDMARTVDFYRRLGFDTGVDPSTVVGDYVSMRRGAATINACRAWEKVAPEVRRVPAGAELVLMVDDVQRTRDEVVAAGVELESDLTLRPWNLVDFRVFDPDGYYLRFTSRAEGATASPR